MSAYTSYVELAAEVRRAYVSGDWSEVDERIGLPNMEPADVMDDPQAKVEEDRPFAGTGTTCAVEPALDAPLPKRKPKAKSKSQAKRLAIQTAEEPEECAE